MEVGIFGWWCHSMDVEVNRRPYQAQPSQTGFLARLPPGNMPEIAVTVGVATWL